MNNCKSEGRRPKMERQLLAQADLQRQQHSTSLTHQQPFAQQYDMIKNKKLLYFIN